jgi:hypothetical protein
LDLLFIDITNWPNKPHQHIFRSMCRHSECNTD